jgi:hypothetical protein
MRRFVGSLFVLGLVLVPAMASAAGAAGSSAQVTAIPIEATASGWVIHDVEGTVSCPAGQTYTGTVMVKAFDGATLYSASVRGRCNAGGSAWRIVSQQVSEPGCPTEALAGGRIKLSGGSRFAISRSQWVFPSCG